MSNKRTNEAISSDNPLKKRKTGFQVGPANLPDGTYRRKVQKIKQNLIQKAQLKKDLARAKVQEKENEKIVSIINDAEQESTSNDIHPDRQAMMDAPPEPTITNDNFTRSYEQRKPHRSRPKQNPLDKEAKEAERRKEEAEARQQAREDGDKERMRKIEERNRLRKAMDKARQPGKNGQRRLGRESVVLLERVKKLMDKT